MMPAGRGVAIKHRVLGTFSWRSRRCDPSHVLGPKPGGKRLPLPGRPQRALEKTPVKFVVIGDCDRVLEGAEPVCYPNADSCVIANGRIRYEAELGNHALPAELARSSLARWICNFNIELMAVVGDQAKRKQLAIAELRELRIEEYASHGLSWVGCPRAGMTASLPAAVARERLHLAPIAGALSMQSD